MDVIKYFSCFVCMVLFIGPEITDAQGIYTGGIYPRRPFFGGGVIYPRHPIGFPRGGLYPRGGIIYPREELYDPAVLPVVGGAGIAGRPVISDRSDTRRQNINISNNNKNVREEHGSGNVNVNQVTSTRSRNCECQVGVFMEQCGPYRQCVPDSSCSGGGNNGVCQDVGVMGHGGIMI